MIVEMRKVYVASRQAESGRLLETLRELGVMHLAPVDPQRAVAGETTVTQIDHLQRAIQVLGAVEPAATPAEADAEQAVEEVLRIERESGERRSRLGALYRQLAQLAVWGDVRLEQFDDLRAAGVDVKFYTAPNKVLGEFAGECVQPVAELSGKRSLVAVAARQGAEVALPEEAEEAPLPQRDRPGIRAEAAEIDEALKRDRQRLRELAPLAGEMRRLLVAREREARFMAAQRGGLAAGGLYAVQGWVPAEQAESLAGELSAAGITAGVDIYPPSEDEQPPTLIRYPRWARPIKGLFDMLGSMPGYREFDVSAPFMVALPIFAAMLIGDGGYGLILFLVPMLFFKKTTAALGREFTRLLAVIGAATLLWGLMNASFFGVLLYDPVIPVNMTSSSRNLIMRISFYMAAVHLSFAQVWRGIGYWPSLKTAGRVGWALFIWGMLGVVKMFVLNDSITWEGPWLYLLIVGATLAILFEKPSRNPLKMVALGLANFPLSMLSAFSDVISYVRLMAVGLASGVLAASFNELALSTGTWVLAVPVMLFGHGLNLGLALIAIFAHGVRLNMLEFSNNLGMQWLGYAYEPFARKSPEEIKA